MEEKKKREYLNELVMEKNNNENLEKSIRELESIEQKYLEQYHKTKKIKEEKQKKLNLSMMELTNNEIMTSYYNM